MNASFIRASESEWLLSRQLAPSRRRQLLHGPCYEQLVEALAQKPFLAKVAREKARDVPNYFRAVVTLNVSSTAIDLFYNGASGYRAQYYQAADLGTLANRYALDRLLPVVTHLVAAVSKRTCPASWVQKSLSDPDAKLWPHQGVWLRYARTVDRNLLVARWLSRQDDPNKELQKRAKRSRLTPHDEHILELKGGFLSPAGEPLGTFKPKRSQDLHELGYT